MRASLFIKNQMSHWVCEICLCNEAFGKIGFFCECSSFLYFCKLINPIVLLIIFREWGILMVVENIEGTFLIVIFVFWLNITHFFYLKSEKLRKNFNFNFMLFLNQTHFVFYKLTSHDRILNEFTIIYIIRNLPKIIYQIFIIEVFQLV
jgi:hypothetical protein